MRRSRAGEEFRAHLAHVARVRRACIARGVASVLLAAALAALSLLLPLHLFIPSWWPLPFVSFALFWGGVAAAFLTSVFKGAFIPRGSEWLASLLDGGKGGGGLVTAALEFSGSSERLDAYSPYLMQETVRRAGEGLRSIEASKMFASASRPGWTLAAALAAILLAAQIFAFRADTTGLLKAVSDPALYFRRSRGFNLRVTSGDGRVLAGGEMIVEAAGFGSKRGEVLLMVSTVPGLWKEIPVARSGAGVLPALYKHTFSDIREDIVYYFKASGERTGSREVTVVHRPVINGIGARLTFPAYTGEEPEVVEMLAGKLVTLSGTMVDLHGETSKELDGARIRFRSGADIELSHAGRRFSGSFRISGSDTFAVEVTDISGLRNEKAVSYPVVPVEDREPFVEILSPEDESMLPRSLVMELLYRASDDYGISSVKLHYTREGKSGGTRVVDLGVGGGRVRETEGHHTWSLKEEKLLPGDRILYFLEVFDNNTATGPNSTRTGPRRLLVPSLSEIYARIREQENLQRTDFGDLLDRGREIKERMKRFSEELKSGGELDWSRRRESAEILEKQRELQEKVRDAAGRLESTLDMLERNRMTSQEIGEKIEKIHELVERIGNRDLRDAIESFGRMLNEASRRELIPELDELEANAEDLVRSLDRTIELLERVLREERMEELARRLEEMLGEQEAIRDSTAAGDAEELAGRQEGLGDEAERFEEDLGEFAEDTGDSGTDPELEGIFEDLENADLDELMRRAARDIRAGERGAARCKQDTAIDKMISLYTGLESCRMQMGITLDGDVAERLMRAAGALVEISKLEEALVVDLHSGSRAEELTADQLVLKEAAQGITSFLYETARRTLAVPQRVFVHLGYALQGMEAVLQGIADKRLDVSTFEAGATYTALNSAVIELLRSASSSGGAEGAGRGMMQELVQRQLALNRRLRRLLSGAGVDGWSQEERAGMARLAAEQRDMQNLLKRMMEESMGAGSLLGRLDDVEEKMGDLAERIEEGRLDEELMEHEERILSRMLDSQRSLQRRDYSRERISTTGGDIPPLGPEGRDGETDDRRVILELIRRGMRGKGPGEYEELNGYYFRALSRKVREGAR